MNELTVMSVSCPESKPKLLDKLQKIEALVGKKPLAPEHRWALVEILCHLYRWDRALQHLQIWARLQPERRAEAQLVRGLIHAEHLRTRVFRGKEQAAPVVDFPDWMQSLAEALKHNAAGDWRRADECRLHALSNAPGFVGTCSREVRVNARETAERSDLAVQWLADSDTRLGPVCEVMVAGAYRWLAFADLVWLQLQAPRSALDLVWAPAYLKWRSNSAEQVVNGMYAYLPARACWTDVPAVPTESQEALMLGQLTEWVDVGETGVFSQGQKTWMTNACDIPLLDVRELRA